MTVMTVSFPSLLLLFTFLPKMLILLQFVWFLLKLAGKSFSCKSIS
jgi:hypothetical protein